LSGGWPAGGGRVLHGYAAGRRKTARAEKLGAVLCHLSRRAGSTRSDTALCWVETDPPLLTEPVET
jgi:hypothetical protein